MSDRIVRGILRGQELVVIAATSTAAAREARQRHGLAPTSAQLLASGLLAGGILSALQKSDRTRINLQIECDGPARGLFVDANTFGQLRGYVKSKTVRFPIGQRFEAQQALGTSGYISVLRDIEGVFYRGSVGIEHKDLSRDLEHYFATSEQIDTAVQLEVVSEGDDELGWVGGLLVQKLPNGNDAALADVRRRLLSGAVFEAVNAGARTPEALVEALFGAEALETRADIDLVYTCPCSRERVLRALQTFGPAELFEMIHQDGKAEVDCDFCGQHYLITKDEMQGVLDMIDRADAEAEAAAAEGRSAPAPKRETLH